MNGGTKVCSGINGDPSKRYVHVPEPVNGTLFGNRIFTVVIKYMSLR